MLCINPYQDLANSLTLSSAKDFNKNKQLNQIVLEAVRQQSETGYPQAIILSGMLKKIYIYFDRTNILNYQFKD